MKLYILAVFLFLVSCQDNSGISAQQRNAAATDKITYQIYTQVMDSALGKKLGDVSNNLSLRKGESNPYRKGVAGYSHKAIAACLVWDADNVVVRCSPSDQVGQTRVIS